MENDRLTKVETFVATFEKNFNNFNFLQRINQLETQNNVLDDRIVDLETKEDERQERFKNKKKFSGKKKWYNTRKGCNGGRNGGGNFRLICKLFKEMLYGFTIKELNIDHPNYRNLSNWIFINQTVNPLYSTNQDNLVFSKIITSSLFNFKLKRLRIINFNECLRLNLAILNKFHQLEQLEIRITDLEVSDFKLSLANLKVFRINVHVYNNIPNQIQIDTPNLSVLDLVWDDIFKNCYEYI